MYEKVSTKLDFTSREEKVLKFWKENEIFEKSIEEKKDLPTYTFYDGPPTANGKPHIGHVLTRVIKDMIPRYQTMKGQFRHLWIWGYSRKRERLSVPCMTSTNRSIASWSLLMMC